MNTSEQINQWLKIHATNNTSINDKLQELNVLLKTTHLQPQYTLSDKNVKKVECLLADKNISNHKWYLVKWVNETETTWEPIENISRYTLQLYHLNKEAKIQSQHMTQPRDYAYLYLRTSTPRTNDGQVSIEVQKNELMQYCRVNNVAIKGIYLDEGASARNMKNLEGLDIILNNIQPNDVLMVWDISRFSRNSLQALHLLEDLSKQNIQIYFLKENISYDTAMNKHYVRQALSTAQLYSDTISEKVKSAIQYKKSKGSHIGKTKYGYTINNVNGIRKLVKCKKEQNDIKLIQNICNKIKQDNSLDYLSSEHYNYIANILNSKNIKFRGRAYTKSNVSLLAKRQ